MYIPSEKIKIKKCQGYLLGDPVLSHFISSSSSQTYLNGIVSTRSLSKQNHLSRVCFVKAFLTILTKMNAYLFSVHTLTCRTRTQLHNAWVVIL